jgi:multidrug efflux pump subunit AcrB
MNFSAWSIRNPLPPVLLFFVLTVLGIMSFYKLPITRFPNIDIPLVSVSITDPGVAPSELETQVTKKIEDAVANITGVKNVISNLSEGNSTTAVEFRLEVQTAKAVSDVKDAIERIKSDLPATANDPVINSIDVEGQAIQTYAVSAPQMTIEELSWFVDDKVIRILQGQKGVGRVERNGGVKREIKINLDPQRLMALGLSAGNVNQAVRGMSGDFTGGKGELGNREQAIRALGGSTSIEALGSTEIPLAGGRTVRLSDLGTVEDAWEDPKSFARVNDQSVVAFAIFRAKGASDVDVAKRIAAAVTELKAAHPDVQFELVDDSVAYTYGNYESALGTLVEGALLAVIIVFLFLREWRATLISAVALPLSIIPTFWAMDLLGFSMNLVSLLGITLVTGILVDDAIVEIENIVRHIRMGKTPYRASMEAADEIGMAVIAISITIIAIFAPVSFMSGVAGQYFKQFGLTVAFSVFFSLLVARLITPMMAAYLMRDTGDHDVKEGIIMRGYLRTLKTAVRHRWITTILGFAFFGASIYATGFLPTGFIPLPDNGRIIGSIELAPGAPLDETRAVLDRASKAVRDVSEVKRVYVIGGSSPTGDRESRRATMIVILKDKSERERKQFLIEPDILAKLGTIPDIRSYFVNDRGERQLAFGITGTDGNLVSQEARKIQSQMTTTGKFRAVTSNAALDRAEIIIKPSSDRLAQLGITTSQVSEALRVATIGDIDANLAKFTVGDRQIPIRIRLNDDARGTLETLQQLPIPTGSGVSVPLGSIAKVEFGQGPATISRFNRERRVVIGADMAGGAEIGDGMKIVRASDAVKNLNPAVKIKETGDAEIMGEVFGGFRDAMIMGLMLVFVVLILLFGSIFHSFTILMSLPLSLGGVVAALWMTGNSISMPVVIGILMLMGIVTKNAIMLVDFAVERVKHGMSRFDAVIDSGHKRARPIMMTTIAMSGGMFPAALAHGAGGEFRAPMAIAVIGGLLVSTVLSLVFVPAVYTIMDDVARGISWLTHKALNPNKADDLGVELTIGAREHANSKPQLVSNEPRLAAE